MMLRGLLGFASVLMIVAVAQAQTALLLTNPDVIKRRLTQSNWLGTCQDSIDSSLGTILSLAKDGSGLIVNYSYRGTGCSGAPVWINRAAVRFRTATSEDSKTAVDLAVEPLRVGIGQPVAYSYRLTGEADGTILLTPTKYALYEGGKVVTKNFEGSSANAIVYYPLARGLTLKDYLEARLRNFNRSKVEGAIDAIRVKGDYPALLLAQPPIPIGQGPVSLGSAPVQFFQALNKYVFGREHELALYSGVKPGVAQVSPQLKAVALDPMFEASWRLSGPDGQGQVELALVQEVATYLYEFYLQKMSSSKQSLHQQGSLFTSRMESLAPSEKTNRDLITVHAVERSLIKAEMDAWAMSLFVKMGADVVRLKERFEKNRRMIENVAYDGNVSLETEMTFIGNDELPGLIELYLRELSTKKYLKQY